VLPVLVQLDLFGQLPDGAVHPDPRESLSAEVEEQLPVLPFPASDDGRQDHDPTPGRQRLHPIDHLLDGLGRDDLAALRTVRRPDPSVEDAEIVVDLGDRPHRRAWVLRGRLLLDGDSGRQALDRVDVGLLHLLEELPGVGGQALDVPALPLGVDGVEGERRFPGARQAGHDDQPLARNLEVDVLEVVLAGAADDDPIASHGPQ